ncbi:hypothetical protein [Nodularia sp. UHCC 0506]|uniref:hypothetical protein n=1 Tax=Nodularia sp. UHCC 0506 TaxID=3110243 RepID=UPI002B21A62B|nr:hypothetical protein [Nodularia sp. UHCC 0506]MEA5515103.1 hypothetical protein [Nodularia sp. UHCC 0506]
MTKTLTIQLSDELEHQLKAEAEKLNLSLEELVLQSLGKTLKLQDSDEEDPVLPLLGTLRFENSDIGENHDQYLQESGEQELKIAE